MMRDEGQGLPAEASQAGRGRAANSPNDIPAKGLRDVFWRVIQSVMADRVTLIAAGVTYFLLLSLFPALGALVALYGFVADPTTIMGHIGFVASVFPPGSFDLIVNQLTTLTQQKTSTLSFAFVAGLLVAIWSANSGMKALFDAMNVAYQEQEKRSFVRVNLLSLAFTFGALMIAIVLRGCGRKLGPPGGSSCIPTQTDFEPLSFTSGLASDLTGPFASWVIPQRMR